MVSINSMEQYMTSLNVSPYSRWTKLHNFSSYFKGFEGTYTKTLVTRKLVWPSNWFSFIYCGCAGHQEKKPGPERRNAFHGNVSLCAPLHQPARKTHANQVTPTCQGSYVLESRHVPRSMAKILATCLHQKREVPINRTQQRRMEAASLRVLMYCLLLSIPWSHANVDSCGQWRVGKPRNTIMLLVYPLVYVAASVSDQHREKLVISGSTTVMISISLCKEIA